MLVDINHWYLRSFKGGLKANLTFPQTEVQLFWIDKYLVFFLLCSLPFPIHISILCSMNHRILLHVGLLHFTHLIPLLIVVSSSGLIFSTTVSSLSWNCGDAPVALIYNPLQGLVNSCLVVWDISKLVETLCPQPGNTGQFGREQDKCTPEEFQKSWRSFLMLEHHFPAWSFLQVLEVCCWVG